MNTSKNCILVVAIGTMLTIPRARADERSETIEEFFSHLVQAARAPNNEEVLGYFSLASRQRLSESVKAATDLNTAESGFQAALDRQFASAGALLRDPTPYLASPLTKLASLMLIGKEPRQDGSIVLRVRMSTTGPKEKSPGPESTLIARREDGRWKIEVDSDLNLQRTRSAIAALEHVTKAVDRGKYKDRLSAMWAADSALRGDRGSAP